LETPMHEDFGIGWRQRLREACLSEIGASALAHGTLLFLLARAAATLGEDYETISHEQIATMRAYLASSDRQSAWTDDEVRDDAWGADDTSRGGTEDQRGASGPPRNPTPRGPGHAPSLPHDIDAPSREHLLEEASRFGMISLLGAESENVGTVTSPWGAVLGNGAPSQLGFLAGTVDEVAGTGLSLSGGGEGGGGQGSGISLDRIGTKANGVNGQGFGCGHPCSGRGRHSRNHQPRAPIIGCAEATHYGDATILIRLCGLQMSGRLPPETIQRVIQQNHGRFRLCYELGLAQNPALAGRVSVKFVIARDGAVAMAAEDESDLPDQAVRECVVRVFGGLSFPSPEGGIVTVKYPLVLSPAE
jgi:hypothetical protein